MKLSFCLSLLAVLWATNGYAQMTNITLKADDVKVSDVLREIENQSEFFFLYSPKLIDVDRTIDLDVKNTSVKDILIEIFGNQTRFTVLDRQIILAPNDEIMKSDYHQQHIVTGTVTDASTNQGMDGVSVSTKGTSAGTITDVSGKYSITVGDADSILVFSFVGFNKQEIPISGRSSINVGLNPGLTGLDEVIVIGYGTVKRNDLVSAISSVAISELKTVPTARVDESLTGRTTGTLIQNTSAGPDGIFNIRIRGSNSLQGSNDPLIVIDGFIGGLLSSINPNDIASLEVLKDASSTAIYGSRGANGVILVTTKKGGEQAASVEYNSYVNFLSPAKKLSCLSAGEFAETVNANRAETGVALVYTQEQIDGFYANGGTDWQDVIFRNAVAQNHQISVSGGTKTSNYYISASHTDNEGIIRGSSFNSYSLRSNLDASVLTKFKMGVNLFLNSSMSHPSQTGGLQDRSPVHAALLWGAVRPIYNEDGTYSKPGGGIAPPAVYNPLALAIEPIRDNKAFSNELNSYLNWDIIKGLSANVIFGARIGNNENSSYYNTKPSGSGRARASISNYHSTILQNTNQINYDTRIANVHSINAVVAFEQQIEKSNSSTASSQDFITDEVSYNNLGLGNMPQVPSSSRNKKVILSYVGRVNYSYGDKYLVSFSSRFDGASVFGDDKWGFFPSIAGAWRLSGEEFMKSIKTINNLKIRASIGVTGNQGVSPYSSLAKLSTNLAYDLDGRTVTPGVGINTIANPELTWEKTQQANVGVDLGLLAGRFNLTADYYVKKTKDLLMSVPLPTSSGYASVLKNIGKTQNKGFELAIEATPITGKFVWNTSVNWTVNHNKVIELSGVKEVVIGTTGFPNFGNTQFLVVGQPMGVLKGYIQTGIWSTAEVEEAAVYGTIPGAPKYLDVNSDEKIDGNDITYMGNVLPTGAFGWNNTFNYKGFDLAIMIQGSYGNKRCNQVRIRHQRQSSDGEANDEVILNRWTSENQNTDVPSFTGSLYEQIQSSRWIEDGSYIRFKTITLGYSLPKSILTKIKLENVRIYASGINLFTMTEYTGYDPEASTGIDALGGIDQAPYPSSKGYSIGLSIVFKQ